MSSLWVWLVRKPQANGGERRPCRTLAVQALKFSFTLWLENEGSCAARH